jgi:hypothetical protein
MLPSFAPGRKRFQNLKNLPVASVPQMSSILLIVERHVDLKLPITHPAELCSFGKGLFAVETADCVPSILTSLLCFAQEI